MNREILVGNGRLLAGFDSQYRLREFYFPFDGCKNLIGDSGSHFIFGFEHKFFSTPDASFRVRIKYLKETLCSSVSLANNLLQIVSHCSDAVDIQYPILVRKIKIRNLADFPRTLSIFHHQNFQLGTQEIPPGRYFDETSKSVFHQAGEIRVAAGFWNTFEPVLAGYSFTLPEELQETVEIPGLFPGQNGSGASHSFIRAQMRLGGFQEGELYLVIVAASTEEELALCRKTLEKIGPEGIFNRASAYWRLWVSGKNINFGNLPEKVTDLFKRSLLVIRANMNNEGRIFTDFEINEHEVGVQGTCRALPALLAAHALDLGGYPDPAMQFYRLLEKLDLPDPAPAISLWAMWRHYARYHDVEFFRTLWAGLISPLADTIADQINPSTGLPLPGQNLWQTHDGIDLFAVSAMFGGLISAGYFALCFGDESRATRYETTAKKIKFAVERHFYNQDLGRFVRAVHPGENHTFQADPVLDSSILGITKFCLFDPDDPRIAETVRIISDKLWVKTPVGGLARFEGDFSPSQPEPHSFGMPGIPCFMTTFWLAEYLIARARNQTDLKQVLPIFEWAIANAGGAGLIPEIPTLAGPAGTTIQPSIRSHAEFVIAVIRYLEKLEKMYTCSHCGQPVYHIQKEEAAASDSRDLAPKSLESPLDQTPPQNIVVFGHEGRQATLSIDLRECLGCGVCVLNCPEKVLFRVNHKCQIDPNLITNCTLCLECETSCPVGAIHVLVSNPEPDENFSRDIGK